ncbi:MAG: sensor domain-containing diguanylate cyclase, partial [Rhodanobacter sp.]|nr:sensor domain-containing diguanylate cyclase [Rhodanobacter sp.]
MKMGRSISRRTRWNMLAMAALTLWSALSAAVTPPVPLDQVATGPLGKHASYLIEQGARLDVAQARAAWQGGAFRPGKHAVASFGIGSPPVWMHLALDNPRQQPLAYRVMVGTTWIDHLEVDVWHDGRLVQTWRSGDAVVGAPHVVPGAGYEFPGLFAPGRSDLFIRADTADPLLLPLQLVPVEQAVQHDLGLRYGYGLLYGFLLALIVYNAVLYLGLRRRSLLYYALYLVSFIATHLAYTGHGLAWIWPGHPGFQRYVILVLMVLFGCAGLLFASRFLELREHAPRLRRGLFAVAAMALALIGLMVGLGSQLGAALVAFSFLLLYAVGMVLLGILTLRNGRSAGRFFLGAVLCGLTGVVATLLTVWGWIPFSALAFHGAEVGVLCEAMLLALALASRVRHQEKAFQVVEHQARIDSLTGLINRRAFFDSAAGSWAIAERNARPLSIAMFDIDNFKSVNDCYGHDLGDRALAHVAHMLAEGFRACDLVARLGGEEFIVLLPETSLEDASRLCERIRATVAAHPVAIDGHTIALTTSVGVATLAMQPTLKALIREADHWLYEAKKRGRNQVVAGVQVMG